MPETKDDEIGKLKTAEKDEIDQVRTELIDGVELQDMNRSSSEPSVPAAV